jgi:Cof subfamily protein (haloacid dehalogenase superfamily)
MNCLETKTIKAFAFDIDGTLTNSQKIITEKTRESLDRLAKLRAILILASGRPLEGVLPIANQLNLKTKRGYIVCLNGALVFDCGTGKAIFNNTIPPQYIRPLVEYSRKVRIAALSYDNGTIITEKPEDKFVAVESRNNGLPIRGVDDLSLSITRPINKMMFVGEPMHILSFYEEIRKTFPNLEIYRSDPYFLEIMNKGIKKSGSLDFLLKNLGLSSHDLMAFGDGINDIPMLDYSGFSVVMDNATSEVKLHGDFITKTNDNDGVAFAIDLFLEGKLC